MDIYIDESGSINNSLNTDFVIALVTTPKPGSLLRSRKRFINSHIDRLRELDKGVISPSGKILKEPNRMFSKDGSFKELKGSQFDQAMRKEIIKYLADVPNFNLLYIRVKNSAIKDSLAANKATAFNYLLKLALSTFIKRNYLPISDKDFYWLHIDERNEAPEHKFFLEKYLNTEMPLAYNIHSPFKVTYYNSERNDLVQIADVFANFYYAYLAHPNTYQEEISLLYKSGILQKEFIFPLW